MTVDVMPELLTVEEAGALLRMGRSRAYQWATSGQMPGVIRVGRSLRVNRRHLLAWIEDETRKADTATNGAGLEVERRDRSTPTAAA